jgi:phosphoribosylformimino-5-aminoimidazole carboxamide ribonucleotide (ProFAR) isomerase
LQEAVACPVIASGGVGSLDDVRRLARAGVAGCIIGRALYDGKFTLTDALRVTAPGARDQGPGAREEAEPPSSLAPGP